MPSEVGQPRPWLSKPAAWNASIVGLIAAGTVTDGATAPSVLSPSPELMITVSASGSSCPAASSLGGPPTVPPPAVPPNTPCARASSRIESTTSASDTSATAPPVRRTTSSTYGPAAGLPLAGDLALVPGATGRTPTQPRANASDTGEQPVACAPNPFHGFSATRPSEPS